MDGTVIIERFDENERFYGEKLPVQDILAGKVRHPPYEIKSLMETIKAAQGDSDFDANMLPTEAPPGHFEIVDDGQTFGIPDKEDPDPYGVLALEKEGMSLKEAGTKKRASWEEFAFNPSPTSPVRQIYERNSQELARQNSSRPNSWRASAFSNVEPKTPSSLRNSMDQSSARPRVYTDTSTQTDEESGPPSPSRWSARSGVSRRSSRGSFANGHHMPEVPENGVLDTSPSRKTEANESGGGRANGYNTPPHTPAMNGELEHTLDGHHDDDEEAHIEEPVVHAVQTVQPISPQAVSKARLVSVPKRGPPPMLPPRNPQRSGPVVVDASPVTPIDSSEGKRASAPVSPVDEAHGHESNVDGATDEVKDKLDDVKLDDDDEDDLPNPWAKVEETRKRESRLRKVARGRTHQAKAEEVAPEVREAPEAVGRARVAPVVLPRPAAQHTGRHRRLFPHEQPPVPRPF